MTGSTAKRLQLGKHLRRLRNDVGMSREEAAAMIECAPTKITHLETGHTTPRKTDQLVLLQLYGADQETITTLEELRQEASQRGWWSTARLPSWLAAYVGLEDEAERLRVWELGIIPGLLQTPSYARLLHAQRDQLPADELDKRVDARMRRQARLDGDRPMHLTAVLAEAALRHCAYERSLAREQFHHLLARARQPNIELYVLPLEAGISVGLSGAFTLLDFPDHLLPPAAYQEYAVGGHVIDDQNVVAQLATLFGKLRGQTLGSDEGLTLIAKLAEGTE